MRTLAAFAVIAVCACSKPGYKLGPMSLVVPEEFKENPGIEQKVAEGRRESRVWRDDATKMVLSLTVSRLPHQPEWSQYPVHTALDAIIDQAVQAGKRAGLIALRTDRRDDGATIRYELDSKLVQGDKTLFTFSRAGIWLDADGTLVNATAVCTSDDAHQAKCGELLKTFKLEAPEGARQLDGGA
jgi:hypothetical protein